MNLSYEQLDTLLAANAEEMDAMDERGPLDCPECNRKVVWWDDRAKAWLCHNAQCAAGFRTKPKCKRPDDYEYSVADAKVDGTVQMLEDAVVVEPRRFSPEGLAPKVCGAEEKLQELFWRSHGLAVPDAEPKMVDDDLGPLGKPYTNLAEMVRDVTGDEKFATELEERLTSKDHISTRHCAGCDERHRRINAMRAEIEESETARRRLEKNLALAEAELDNTRAERQRAYVTMREYQEQSTADALAKRWAEERLRKTQQRVAVIFAIQAVVLISVLLSWW